MLIELGHARELPFLQVELEKVNLSKSENKKDLNKSESEGCPRRAW